MPFPPGGSADILSRLVAQKLTEQAKWSIVADNKAGAGGTIGITEAVKAAPTGHDLVMGQKDNLVIGPWLYKNLPWDPSKDLVAVAHVAYSPVIIATSVNSKYKTLADVVAAAKAAPGKVTCGSPGSGTSIHLTGHLFKAGKLRPLAVTSLKRSSSLPDVPTVAESGFRGFDVSTWYGLFAPAGTPAAIVNQVNAEVNKLLAQAEVQAAIQAQGAEPEAMTPAKFQAQMRTEYAQWKSIVEASGAKID